MAKKKKSVADDIINGEYEDMWKQANAKSNNKTSNSSSNNILPTKEKVYNMVSNDLKQSTQGLLPFMWKNFKQGVTEGTAGIGQGQILSASNEAKKISEKSNRDKLKDLNETMLRTLNPIYGITKKSFKIGQNTLDTLRNKDKTAKEKVADILTSGVSSVKDMNNPIGDVVKLSGKTAGIINNKAGDKLLELNEKIDKPLRENREKLQEEGQNYSNAVRMAGTVSNVVGNMTPSIVASRLGGGNEALSQALSLGTMGLSVKGRATQEALSKGAELDKAIKIGDTKAMTEVGTELLTGGLNIFGKGALDNIVERGINKKVTNNVLNYLAKQGAGIAGEVGEETISDILNTVIDQGTVDPNATYSMKDWSDTALTTMLSTVVLNALGGAYTPRAYNQNVQEMEQYKAKQDITERINNSNLSEEDKSNMLNYVQNEDFTQADYNAMRETIENSEQPIDTISQEQISSLVARIDKSNLPNEDKLMMKDYIQNNNVSQADIDSMNKVIDSAVSIPANNELVTNQNFKDNVEARKKYTKYKNDTGEYNSNAINEVLDLIPENRNGNRTVKQWLQVAKETGTRIADLSNEEIERIAYKSWFDVQPSKNITKYDRQTKSTAGFQKLTSDEWINEINRAVNEVRNNNQTQNVANNQENNKQKQLDIIQKNNPMTDDYHTGIRNIEDIKTFDEVINDDESFVYGDFTKEDADKALKEGKVTVYSSKPIEQGSFVSTSQNMAKDYAGNGKIYSQEVDLKDVAWINGDEGQYARLENNQETLYNNNERESGINDTINRGTQESNMERDIGESRLFEKQKQIKEQQYREWEKSIKPKQESSLTKEERQLKKDIIESEGKDIVFIENDNKKGYHAGGSLEKPNVIYINTEKSKEFGLKRTALHESMESNIRFANENDRDIITSAIQDIVENKEFENQKLEFWENQKGEIPDDSAIAKDLICDRYAELKGEEIDYKIFDYVKDISDMSIQFFNYKTENSNKSSFIMPTAENTNENNIQETEINPYRNTGRANKLIKEKNIKIEQLENQLKQTTSQEKQNNIQQEIQNIEKQYNEQIQTLYDEINNKDNKESKAPTRHEVIQKNREIARQNIKNIANWNDKKSGIRYQLETMERNMYDIIPDKAEAKRMNDTYFEPIHTAEADKQKFINKYNDRIKKLELNKYEAEAVQVLGEQKYNPSFDAKEAEKALDNVKKNIEKGKIDQEKVDNAIEEFRSIYDELFDLENKVLRDNGYKEKDYRKGYFPHFIDYTPETTSEKILNKLGFKIDKRPLPTDIAGITEQFVPGKTWNRSALQRKTNKTDYNALKGFDTYIAQASDNIFHTENIQKLRGLENEIRYQYSDKGVQKRIDDILNNDILDADEKQDMIDAILKQVENPMPNLVTELRRYTNALANKKSEADRSMEQMAGRQVYSTINAIENKFGANAVGLNIGSAVTNFIPITQAWSQIGTKNIARASIDYSKSLIEDDGFVNKSAFLTSRLNQAEKLYQTWSDKATSKANFLFDAIDDVASNIVVRGKYLENIQKGMSETEAIKNADQFARNVIADRSKGALPTKFEEKNPISKAFTQFQLEVNNQYRYMFKDIPRDLKEKGLGAIAIAYLKMFVGAWLYNKFAEKITGRKPAFSPIDLIKSSYDTIKDEKMGTYEKITKIGKDIGEQAPFIGGFLGGGRIPINGALPNIANVTKAGIGLATGEMDSKKAKETLGKEFSKPLYYLLPPLGGGQLKKSVEGISVVKNGGSYGTDRDGKDTLQFPVENKNALNYIKAGVFGKYALPEAKTYTESGFKSLNAKQTEAYKETKLPYKEFIEYSNNKLEKTSDKINYINNMKISDDQKWGLYKYDILSSTTRDDGTSQKTDAEYAINNKMASKKEYMDLYNKANKNNINMPNTEELKKIKEQGITLKTFVDYKINSKGNKKQSDKIQALLDSKYSNEEKGSIYKNYINKYDNQYEIMNTTGIDIDEYLKYKQQSFKSDTTDNGTLNGKSERNKKNKVVKYLNSMNIKGNQRLLLYAMEGYKTTASQKNQLVKYVKGLDLTGEEKLKVFNKFSGFKVYKNGKIKY